MRLRVFLAAAAAVSTWVFGCNVLTGVGNLTFNDDAGPPNQPEGGGGNEGGSSSGPIGTRVATSASLVIQGMTSDGYVAYGDVLTNTLWALGIEQPDGGPPSSSSPVTLGGADLLTSNVDGRLVEFFSPSSEVDAGPSRVGTLNVWSSSMSAAKSIASGVLEPDFAKGFLTVAASPDGQYVAYLGNVDSSGATAALVVTDTQTGSTKQLVGSIDVLEDACQPRLSFSGAYVVAAYCQVPAGGHVSSGLPDGGTNYYLATVSSFVASTGQSLALASNVRTAFAADVAGVGAVMAAKNGLVASALSGDAGVVAIDPAGTGGVLSVDGKSVVYATTSSALKRAKTSAPPGPVQLVSSSFNFVAALSGDGNWALGGTTVLPAGTGDWYAASAQQPGSAVALSAATTAAVHGSYFTGDSKYALFATGVDSSGFGAMTAYPLGGSGGPISLGSGSSWALGAKSSQVVFNLNASGYKADLEWVDLATGTSPTLLVAQADGLFLLGPALDKVVYTYSDPQWGGLWVLDLGTICTGGGAIVYHPPAGSRGSCTSQEVSTYDTSCVRTHTESRSCGEPKGISASCLDCLISSGSASQWGAINDIAPLAGSFSQLNYGGCFARDGSSPSIACAAAQQAQTECEDNTCASQPDSASFQTCQVNSDSATCACYVANAISACAALSSSPCNSASYASFEDGFLAIAKVMCE